MADDEDRDLQRWFAAQRHEEQDAAPPFARVWAAARAKRRPRPRVRFAVAAVALALVALLWLRPDTRPTREPPAYPSVAEWRSPTDFLLTTPGWELLSTVPALVGSPIPGLGLAMPPTKPSSTPKGDRS